MTYQNCTLCPRTCRVDRTAGQRGFCGGGDQAVVAKSMIHHWEEPCLAGEGGSGAIFFAGCTMKCSYCQNAAISRCPEKGEVHDSESLRALMEGLIAQGAENIDLVTPTHYLPTILPALEKKLPVPVVYNCGGYERVTTVESLAGKVDIFLPDFKYYDNRLAVKYSAAPDYYKVATRAIEAMVKIAGPIKWEGDKVVSGVIIRHLVLPGHLENTYSFLDWVADTFAKGEVLVSLMAQYTPMGEQDPPMDRPLTPAEYDAAVGWMQFCGLEGFVQELSSADEAFIPDFN